MDDGGAAVTTDAACAAEEVGRDDRAADGSKGSASAVQWWKRPPRPPPSKADAQKDKKKNKRKAGEDMKQDLDAGSARPAVVQRTLMDFDRTPRRPQYEAPRPRGCVDLEVHGYWRRRDGSLLYKFPNGETRVAHGADEWSADLL